MAFLLFIALVAPAADTAELEQRMVELINMERGGAERSWDSTTRVSPRTRGRSPKYSERMAASGRVDHELDRPT